MVLNCQSLLITYLKVQDKVSSWSPAKGGAVFLGPLLFLVYINAILSLIRYGRLLQISF